MLEGLDSAPWGFLSILNFDVGAYSRRSFFEGRGLLKKFYSLQWGLVETAYCFVSNDYIRRGNVQEIAIIKVY